MKKLDFWIERYMSSDSYWERFATWVGLLGSVCIAIMLMGAFLSVLLPLIFGNNPAVIVIVVILIVAGYMATIK